MRERMAADRGRNPGVEAVADDTHTAWAWVLVGTGTEADRPAPGRTVRLGVCERQLRLVG